MAKPFHLKNGTILLSTEAPGGLYNAAQLKKIAAISDASMAIVKATEDQRLALFVKEADAAKIAADLKSIGLGIRHYQDGLHQPTACIGELCPDHEQDALGAAMNLTKELADIKIATPLKIGLNGCAACCVPCHTLDISIVGDASGYRVSLGGKNAQLPEMATFMAEGVPAAELAKLVKKVVALYQQHAQDDENLQAVMERVGAGSFIAALAPYSQDAAGSDDPFAGASTDDLAEDTLTPVAEDEVLASDAMADEGLEDITMEDDNLTMAADLGVDEDLGLDTDTQLENLDVIEDTTDLELAQSSTEELELLAKDDGDTLLKDDLAIDGVDDLGELEEDISANDDSAEDVLTDEIPFTEDDLLMEDPTPATDTMPVAEPVAAKSVTPSPSTDEEILVEEAGDDFEAQLEESIAEEENIRAMSEPDDLLQARDEALDILEEQINQPNEFATSEAAPVASAPVLPPQRPSAPVKPMASARARKDLCGLSMDDQGHLILEFDGGATVALDPTRFIDGAKTLKISGQTIHITATAEGYHVEADGMTFFQPTDGGLAAA